MSLLGYTLLVVSKVVVLTLGFTISLLSYLSYKRHYQKIMLEIAIGFSFIAFGSFVEGIMYELLDLDIVLDHLMESIFILIGMSIIAHAMLQGSDSHD